MAEQLHMEALVEFASKNADLTEKQVKAVQDAVDHLNRNGKIDEIISNRASQQLERTRGSVRAFSSEFKNLRQEIADTNAALASSAQNYVVRGGRDPLGHSASQLSASQARKILAVDAAGSMTATKAARERLDLEDRLNKAKSQGVSLDKDLVNAGKSRATVARENLAAAEAEIAALKEARSAAPQTGRRGVSSGWDIREEVALEEALTAAKKRRNQAQIDLNRSTADASSNLAAQRYAQYDLASTYGAVTAALVGLGAVTTSVFADIEKGFATVQSVTATFNDESAFKSIEQDLLDLSRTLPATVEGIQQLAVRGAQLGVANNELDNFVDVMSKFVAVNPDANINDVAEAFGRIANLTGVRDFERLASAISAVGIEGASTSPQILKTTQEVAPLATAAGMSADEIIGLSSALASLSQAPERARSALGTLYNTMDKGIAGLNDKLPAFASFLGKTSEETAKLYKTSPAQFIRELTQALAKTDNMTAALSNLGLSEKRAQQVFGALAASARNSADGQGELARQMDIATRAYRENVALQQQFQPIADTLAAKWQILKNSLVELAYAVGTELGPAISEMVGGLSSAIQGVTDFISSPIGEWSVKFVAALASAAAAYTGLRTAIALATGAQLAFQQITALTGRTGIVASLQGLAGGFGNVEKSGKNAAGGIVTFGKSLGSVAKGAGIIGVIVTIIDVLSDIPKWAVRAGNAILWLVNLFNRAYTAIGNLASNIPIIGKGIQQYTKFIKDSNSWVGDMGRNMVRWGEANKKTDSTLADLGGSTSNLSGYMGDLEDQASGVADALGGGGGGSGGGGVAGGAKKAEKAIRTLIDYASDLSSVMDRSFEIRFSAGASADAIVKAFSALKKEAGDSAKRIADLRREIASLKSDLGILQDDLTKQRYFLSIAIEYGDTARAETIQARINKLQTDIANKQGDLAAKQKDLSREQDSNSKTLKGNSDAAVKNRDALRSLVQQYQAQLVALAKSGMSQEALRKKAEQLRADFIKQATQLGFNRREVEEYAKGFDDAVFAIDRVPRDVTIDINANPALTALEELLAKSRDVQDSLSGIGSGGGGGIGGGGGLGDFGVGGGLGDFGLPEDLAFDSGEDAGSSWWDGFLSGVGNFFKKIGDWFLELPGRIRGFVGTASKGVGVFFNEMVPTWLEETRKKFTNWLKELPGKLSFGAGFAFGTIWKWLSDKVVPALATAWTTVVNWFKNLPSRIGATVRNAGSRVWSFLRDELPKKLSNAWTSIVNWFKSLPSRIRTTVRTAATSMWNGINRASAGLSKALTSLTNWFRNLPSNIWSAVRNAATDIWNNFAGGFSAGARNSSSSRRSGRGKGGRFWTGGYTGRGGKYEPAGIVHRGEYVIPANQVNQATGLPYADALGRLMRGSSGGSIAPAPVASTPSSSTVNLSPGSVQALAHAIKPHLFIDGKMVADASSKSYAQQNTVGAY